MMKPPFPVGGGDKKIEDSGGDGLKNFRTGGVIDLGGGGAFAGGVRTPLYAMIMSKW